MAEGSGLSAQFLSLVLLPLAGNAVEHITAVMVAIKNKMDLALAIAIGSSIQIAIFVLPTCVLFAWSIDNPFSLQLDPLGTHIKGQSDPKPLCSMVNPICCMNVCIDCDNVWWRHTVHIVDLDQFTSVWNSLHTVTSYLVAAIPVIASLDVFILLVN